MVNYCEVVGCFNKKSNTKLSFFSLPKQEERRNKWLDVIDRPDLIDKPPKNHYVCSVHFDKTKIKFKSQLVTDAIPSKLLPNEPHTSKDNTNEDCSDVSTQTAESYTNVVTAVNSKGPEKQPLVPGPSKGHGNGKASCTECGATIMGKIYSCVQCADVLLCAMCEQDEDDRHRRHVVLGLPCERVYNKVRDLLESLQREFAAKLGIHDGDYDDPSPVLTETDDKSITRNDDDKPFSSTDDDEEVSDTQHESKTIPIPRKRKREPYSKKKRFTKVNAPDDISVGIAVTTVASNKNNETDDDKEPPVLIDQPSQEVSCDPLLRPKIEIDIEETSILQSLLTVETKRSYVNEGTSGETTAEENAAGAEIKIEVKEEPIAMAEDDQCPSFIHIYSHQPAAD